MKNAVVKILKQSKRLKVSQSDDVDTQLTPVYQSLLEKLTLTVQGHANKEYGYFDEQVFTQDFHKALKSYCFKKGAFSHLQAAIIDSIKSSFAHLDQDQEYYLWITQAKSDRSLPICIFLLKHDEGYFFGKGLHLHQSPCIYANKLKYAAIIDPIAWQAQSNRYVTLLAPKNSDALTTAFKQLMSVTLGVDRQSDTEEFLQMVEQYANEVIPDKKKEVTSRVFNYCFDQDRQGQSVNVEKLSQYMDEQSPDSFARYVATHLDSPPEDWHPDRRQVQRYSRFHGRDQHISISFSAAIMGDDVVYDAKTNTLTIKSLPPSLITQLQRYLKKSS